MVNDQSQLRLEIMISHFKAGEISGKFFLEFMKKTFVSKDTCLLNAKLAIDQGDKDIKEAEDKAFAASRELREPYERASYHFNKYQNVDEWRKRRFKD